MVPGARRRRHPQRGARPGQLARPATAAADLHRASGPAGPGSGGGVPLPAGSVPTPPPPDDPEPSRGDPGARGRERGAPGDRELARTLGLQWGASGRGRRGRLLPGAHTRPLLASRRMGAGMWRRDSGSPKGEPLQRRPLSGEGRRPGRAQVVGGDGPAVHSQGNYCNSCNSCNSRSHPASPGRDRFATRGSGSVRTLARGPAKIAYPCRRQ